MYACPFPLLSLSKLSLINFAVFGFIGVTDAGIIAIGSGPSSLQSPDVSYCRKLTDKGLSAVALGCSDLRVLHLSGYRFITDVLLHALSKNCHFLQDLGLQGCTNISASGISDLVSGCRQIEFLDINKCSNIGDTGVSAVAKACSSSLRTLKLLDCYKVGDESIISLANFSKNLETLIIGGCRDISDPSIKLLASSSKNSLKNLRMDWCLNITDLPGAAFWFSSNPLRLLTLGAATRCQMLPFRV